MSIDRDLFDQLRHLVATSPEPVASLSMEQIASRLGMTRMTLYRKAGSRQDIVDALRAVGIDARRQPDVYERAVEATARLLREQPIADVTLERIAGAAGCSLPSLYARFGNREGILKAVIERYSPLIPVREAIASEVTREPADLRHDVRLLYGTVLPRVLQEWPIIRSLLAEVLRDPGSDVGRAFREWYLPQVTAVLIPMFTRHIERGAIRPIPIPILVQMLIGPMGLHGATRPVLVNEFGFDLPNLDDTVELFTDMFCRAVGTEGDAPVSDSDRDPEHAT
jgi:AcrR family transcriptional regulator